MTLTDSDIKKILATDEVRSHNGAARPEAQVTSARIRKLAEFVFPECETNRGPLRDRTLPRRRLAEILIAKARHRDEYGFIPLWTVLLAVKVIILLIEIFAAQEEIDVT